ncbi:MAG: ROK family protein [Oscillospiraceae bacterium]|jgi:fructokinase|nr:ROK family protein [Oscillospiraceae bacterium]
MHNTPTDTPAPLPRLGSLEAGGTKMVCAVGDATGRVYLRERFPTRTPAETLPEIIGFFREAGVQALGIGAFGPIDLHEDSPTYGYITQTPKLSWRDTPLLPLLRETLGVPVGLATDVGAAALAEHALGAAVGLSSCVYVTIGTGIGGGVIAEGRLVRGLMHPEMGHFWLRPHPQDPAPKGFCPYHDGCLEGLASGPAMAKRWGCSPETLPEGHIGWEIEAHYLAQLCMAASAMLSPERIILGGGVMQRQSLLPRIRALTEEMLAGYICHPALLGGMADYIVSPGLHGDSGIIGGLLLAARAAGLGWV